MVNIYPRYYPEDFLGLVKEKIANIALLILRCSFLLPRGKGGIFTQLYLIQLMMLFFRH